MQYPNNIRFLRKLRNMTARELADELGIGTTQMSTMENGHVPPRLDMAFKAAKFFNTTVEVLFCYEGENTLRERMLAQLKPNE